MSELLREPKSELLFSELLLFNGRDFNGESLHREQV